MADLKAFAEQLVNLTVKEVNELAEILKEEYGIEPAAAAVAVAAVAVHLGVHLLLLDHDIASGGDLGCAWSSSLGRGRKMVQVADLRSCEFTNTGSP